MNESTINQLKEIFTPVAEKIGQGAEFGWEVVIQQQYVIAWLGVFWAVLGLGMLAGGIYLARRATHADWVYGNGWAMPSVMLILFSLTPVVIGSIVAITHFLNPAFYALQFLINSVK